MNDRSSVPRVVGGAAVVILSGVAAYFGAGLAHPEPAVSTSVRTSETGGSLESIDRRLGYIEKRLEIAEMNARTALEIARRLEERLQTGTPVGAPAKSDGPTAPAAGAQLRPAGEPAKDDGAAGQMDHLREVAHSTQRGAVVYQMSLFTDATKEGAENRRAQAMADTQSLMDVYALKGDDVEAKIRATLLDHWDRGARDIGPLVHDGLEKSDVATVRERLRGLYAETDKGLRPLFDEKTWQTYEERTTGMRKGQDAILEEFEKERLGIK